MKPFSEYIKNTFSDYLEECLKFHISVEYKFHYPFNNTQLYESLIIESLGRFDNCDDVAEFICHKIFIDENIKTNYKYDLTKYNVFFKYLIIDEYKETSKSSTAVFNDLSNDTVHINLYINKNDNVGLKIENLIIHELLHAYETYNRMTHNDKLLYDQYYFNSYYKRNSFFEISRFLAKCGYFFNSHEQNAYFSGMYNNIKQIIIKNNITRKNFNYDKIINEIKKDSIWKEYFNAGTFIMKIINDEFTHKEMNEIIKTYKLIANKNISEKELKKELNKKWKKFYSKFNQLVPNIICDIICNNENTKSFPSKANENIKTQKI